MQDDIQRQILGAILLVMRPIARALLRVGVGYREFSEIAKTAFVETATKEYGLRGRPTNISRVAVMTGPFFEKVGTMTVVRCRELLQAVFQSEKPAKRTCFAWKR